MLLIDEQQFRVVVQKKLPVFQLLHRAVGASIGALLIATFILAHQGATALPALPNPDEMMQWASYIHAFIAVGCMLLSGFLPGMVMASAKIKTADELFAHLQTVRLVQLALLEAPAMFGMVVCLIGIRNGVMRGNPVFWLNLITTAYFFARLITIYPTEDTLIERLRELEQ